MNRNFSAAPTHNASLYIAAGVYKGIALFWGVVEWLCVIEGGGELLFEI